MKHTHTLGPWHRGEGKHWSREIRRADGDGVAWCGHSQFEADARLIAAAPELLLALKAMHKSFSLIEDDANGMAEAAIAKAEGK